MVCTPEDRRAASTEVSYQKRSSFSSQVEYLHPIFNSGYVILMSYTQYFKRDINIEKEKVYNRGEKRGSLEHNIRQHKLVQRLRF